MAQERTFPGVFTAIATLAAVVSAGFAGAAFWFQTQQADLAPETRTRQCKRDHPPQPDLAAQLKAAPDSTTLTWGRCAWPALEGADDDGFGHGTAEIIYDENATPTDAVWAVLKVRSTCDTVRVQLTRERSGSIQVFAPFVVPMEQIVDDTGQAAGTPSFLLGREPDSMTDLLLVTLPYPWQPKSIRCAEDV